MMPKPAILGLMVIVFTVGLMAAFIVKETELPLILRLGKIISPQIVGIDELSPGLHFKWPVFDKVVKFDKRIHNLDVPSEHFLTIEKKNLIVDSFIKWRIVDVISYFKTMGDNSERAEQRAKQRLGEIIANGLRNEFGKRTINDVVSGERSQIMDRVTTIVSERAKEFGMKIIDVRIKRIELPKEVSSSVYRRMEAEREQYAKKLRSQGEAEAVRIQANADRESIEIIAKAERDAERIRGEGDATANGIYAKTFNQNQEFYALYRSLNAYKKIFDNKSDILVIQPNSEFFNYFNNNMGRVTSSLTTESAAKTVTNHPIISPSQPTGTDK
ncbi:band 7 protein [Thioploca ingrica]|uniref:Protein HflC n=1 Tax=Thioploca ingrica TaxID=40754 RepID=A0A090AMY8_9GAMM|nr:band 7 protein [Thioploca ingrica]